MVRFIPATILAFCTSAALLSADSPPPPPATPAAGPPTATQSPAKPGAKPAREPALRDPTVPGPTLRTLVAKPAGGPVAVPQVELKGRILAGPRTPMITLAIGTQLHMVAEGSRIALPGAGEIQVSKVTAEEVQLQILPMAYTVTLH